MTTLAHTLSDSRVMLRRNLKRQLRYPSMTLMLVGLPIVVLLLFVYAFGGQLGAGLGAHDGRHAYLDYVAPGLLLITVASAVQGTAIMVAMDMTGGVIDRFRTMAIARGAVLTGHVVGSLIQTLLAIGVLIGVAFGLGFHAKGGLLDWLAAIGILGLFAFALIWLAVALRLAATSVESASNTPTILILLPFLGSGFVPAHTMPEGLRQFAEYQPLTPVADSVRGLISGGGIGGSAIAAIAWSLGIGTVAYLWAIRRYNRHRAAEPPSRTERARHLSPHGLPHRHHRRIRYEPTDSPPRHRSRIAAGHGVLRDNLLGAVGPLRDRPAEPRARGGLAEHIDRSRSRLVGCADRAPALGPVAYRGTIGVGRMTRLLAFPDLPVGAGAGGGGHGPGRRPVPESGDAIPTSCSRALVARTGRFGVASSTREPSGHARDDHPSRLGCPHHGHRQAPGCDHVP